MKVVLEFDDFSPINHKFYLLEKIREHYPQVKFSMFTIPWEIRFGTPVAITDPKYSAWVEGLKKSTDWIELCVHGLSHFPMEFEELSEDAAHKRIVVAEKMFQNRKLDYVKIFKAPYWALSKEGKDAAEKLGFAVVEDGYYNWNLKDECPFTDEQILNDKGFIIAHGHMTNDGCDNAIEDVFDKILRLPPETEFIFLSDYLKENPNGRSPKNSGTN